MALTGRGRSRGHFFVGRFDHVMNPLVLIGGGLVSGLSALWVGALGIVVAEIRRTSA